MQDTLGDRLKAVEQAEAGRKAVKGKPLMARLDGRAFHTFTKGLARPYDQRMSQLMIDTTKFLIEQTHALVGYTQSDEISLCWYVGEKEEGQYLFDGKYQKLASVLASLATTFFAKNLSRLPEKEEAFPTFDCRVWQVEDLNDAKLNFIWRQDDAVKNAISMAAHASFSHRELQGVSGEIKKQMLADIGKPFDDHPTFFKMGTFVQRVTRMVDLTQDQLDLIPIQHQPKGPVLRSFVEERPIKLLREIKDAKIILFGEHAVTQERLAKWEEDNKSFISRCIEGEAVIEDVDLFIDLWHNGEVGHGMELREYLGMTVTEYAEFMKNPEALIEILQQRLTSIEVPQGLSREETREFILAHSK